jgi:hypothetical protein
LQIPFHHKRNVEKLQDYIFESKVDGLACVGDEIDVPQLGAFNKGTRAEFERTLQRDFNTAHNVLADFREALGSKKKPFILQRSNHSQRIEKYIYKNAPAFESVTALRIENLLGLNKLGITYQRSMDYIAPGVLMGHGDEGRLYSQGGLTALNLGIRTGQNVVCGHTHRQGISKASRGFGGRLTPFGDARWVISWTYDHPVQITFEKRQPTGNQDLHFVYTRQSCCASACTY